MSLNYNKMNSWEIGKAEFLWTIVTVMRIDLVEQTDVSFNEITKEVYMHDLYIKNLKLIMKKDANFCREDVIVHYEDEVTELEHWETLDKFNSQKDIEEWISRMQLETY